MNDSFTEASPLSRFRDASLFKPLRTSDNLLCPPHPLHSTAANKPRKEKRSLMGIQGAFGAMYEKRRGRAHPATVMRKAPPATLLGEFVVPRRQEEKHMARQ